MTVARNIQAEHGVVCSRPGDRFGYFGWPSLARLADGTLVAGASGLRSEHVCPWGKTVLFFSKDDGRTWSEPRVVNDTPMDDRDCGLTSLGGQRLLVSWFTYDVRRVFLTGHHWWQERLTPDDIQTWRRVLDTWTDAMVEQWSGSWTRVSQDGGAAWSDFQRSPVSAPHGPIVLRDGGLLYFGKERNMPQAQWQEGRTCAARSRDDGRTWNTLGAVPLAPGMSAWQLHEPHVAELPSGKLVGLIRYHGATGTGFSLLQTESTDGGWTWTTAHEIGVVGSPPHLIRHSSGALLCSYGYRERPFGQRVIISRDEGNTWDADWILRDDGPSSDLGYPCSVELEDGTLMTVYYQQPCSANDKCALLYSRWKLPE